MGEENYEEVQKFVADKIIPRLEVIEGVSKVRCRRNRG